MSARKNKKRLAIHFPHRSAAFNNIAATKALAYSAPAALMKALIPIAALNLMQFIDYALNQKEKVVICCDKVDRLSRNTFDKRISTLYEKALRDQLELHFISDGQIINSNISAVEKFQFGISLQKNVIR